MIKVIYLLAKSYENKFINIFPEYNHTSFFEQRFSFANNLLRES